MKQNDVINEVKLETYFKYFLEDGIADIRGGLSLIALGFIFLYNQFSITPILILIAITFFLRPMTKRLSEKYVYPRIGYVVFNKKCKINFENKRTYMLSAYFVISICLGVVFSLSVTESTKFAFHYVNLWITGILFILTLGSFMRNAKYYLYAAMLIPPIACPATFACNFYYIIANIVFFLIAISLFEKPGFWNDQEPELSLKYRILGHNIIFILSSLALIYMILIVSHSIYGKSITHFVNRLFGTTYENIMISVVIIIQLGIGYFLHSWRNILYAFLLIVLINLKSLAPSLLLNQWQIVMFSGIVVMGTGIYVLNRFVRKYPIIEVPDER